MTQLSSSTMMYILFTTMAKVINLEVFPMRREQPKLVMGIFLLGSLCIHLLILGPSSASEINHYPKHSLPKHSLPLQKEKKEEKRVNLTLLKVWASNKTKPAPIPPGLIKFEKHLKRIEKSFNNFRQHGKPEIKKEVQLDRKVLYDLQGDYKFAITLKKGKNQLSFRCQMTGGKQEKPVDIPLKGEKLFFIIKSPIHKGKEQMLMIVQYEVIGD